MLSGVRDGALQALDQQQPVGKTGQPVVMRQPRRGGRASRDRDQPLQQLLVLQVKVFVVVLDVNEPAADVRQGAQGLAERGRVAEIVGPQRLRTGAVLAVRRGAVARVPGQPSIRLRHRLMLQIAEGYATRKLPGRTLAGLYGDEHSRQKCRCIGCGGRPVQKGPAFSTPPPWRRRTRS